VVGYGAYAYADAMVDTLGTLCPDHDTAVNQKLVTIGKRLIEHPIVFLEGVLQTLSRLAQFSRLIMVTQGDHRYQERKISDSGVRSYFEAIEIVPEKNKAAYVSLLQKYNLDPSLTWMVGNSPACDINPASAAGLKALYIPNPYTWEIDLVPIEGTYTVLDRFGDIVDYLALHYPQYVTP
ncbi:HAD family hydrolase, partial [candidate division CSSED10-310 bacterium]